MRNHFKATLYSLDSVVENEGLSIFPKITDTELYFIFYIKIMRKESFSVGKRRDKQLPTKEN